jgi:hypothetical protein
VKIGFDTITFRASAVNFVTVAVDFHETDFSTIGDHFRFELDLTLPSRAVTRITGHEFSGTRLGAGDQYSQ